MVIIEIFVYVCIAFMMAFCLNVINKARLAKRSDFIYFGVLLSLIITQILIQISQEIRGSIHIITYLCIGMILALALVYLLTRMTVSTPEIHENIRGWIVWTMFLVLGISICMLLIEFPNTKADIFRIPLALALCVGMEYYPLALDRLNGLGDNTEESTTEKSIEDHKKAIINLAIEAWRFAKVFERGITQLNAARAKRHTSQLQLFLKKTEESLEDVGLRIVNVEGQPYDPGMAATPLNIEDFEPDDHLVVNQMLEPIIMDGGSLAQTGTVTLRRIE